MAWASGGRAGKRAKSVNMIPKIAYRNLFHDRLSLVVTLVGIVFSVVLLAVQCGIYLGVQRTIAAMMDHTEGDLWIVPFGTKSFDDPSLLSGRERFIALSTPGVASVEDLVVGFSNWRKPAGGITAIMLVGSSWWTGGLAPWDVTQGSVDALHAPGAVAVDETYFADLGVTGIGETAEINGNKVTIAAATHGIRSFITMPYVFTTLDRARSLIDASAEQASYTLVRLAPGADIEKVRADLAARLKDTEVLTREEFRQRSLDYWMFQTGAGFAVIAGALLALIVGIVIVAQTLYASTKDHLNEFATLRALGASAGYINKVILIQALLSAVLGYGFGMALSGLAIWATPPTALLIIMTPGLAAALFAVTIAMCIIAAMSSIFKVIRIDPAGVFQR